MRIAIAPNGKTAYVANSDANTVTPVNLVTNRPRKAIRGGADPAGIAIAPDGNTAYVEDSAAGTVTPVDLATDTPGKAIRVRSGPVAIAITPDGATALVANSVSGSVTPIDLATQRPGKPIPAGSGPLAIAIAPDGATAYVAGAVSNTVTLINITTNTRGRTIRAGARPAAIALVGVARLPRPARRGCGRIRAHAAPNSLLALWPRISGRSRTPLVYRQGDPRSGERGPVVQPGVHAGLSSRRSRVQIPSGPPSGRESVQIFPGAARVGHNGRAGRGRVGRVAQLAERAPEKREVTGSTPVSTTNRTFFTETAPGSSGPQCPPLCTPDSR